MPGSEVQTSPSNLELFVRKQPVRMTLRLNRNCVGAWINRRLWIKSQVAIGEVARLTLWRYGRSSSLWPRVRSMPLQVQRSTVRRRGLLGSLTRILRGRRPRRHIGPVGGHPRPSLRVRWTRQSYRSQSVTSAMRWPGGVPVTAVAHREFTFISTGFILSQTQVEPHRLESSPPKTA
jgi:hypothetical protein